MPHANNWLDFYYQRTALLALEMEWVARMDVPSSLPGCLKHNAFEIHLSSFGFQYFNVLLSNISLSYYIIICLLAHFLVDGYLGYLQIMRQ